MPKRAEPPPREPADQPSAKAWSGRLGPVSDPALERYTSSLQTDLKLARQDIAGSLAHARSLARAQLLRPKELLEIERGLAQAAGELGEGTFQLLSTDEDIHMALERRLTELIGEAGQRLHTGRSRNDQVALDLRLWCRSEIAELVLEISQLQAQLVRRAAQNATTLIPGYTHLQRAQPVQLGHHLLAYFEMLQRDQERLQDASHRTDSSPLGAGALAGNTLRVDRFRTARELGFTRVSGNSLDAVSDRDFVAELLFCCSLVAVHLSRLAEDLVIWNSREFSYVTLPDQWATGSSIMPQKKNPDVLELARGRAARPISALVGILTVLKGLPLSYNRDLQEDKEHLFPAVQSTRATVVVLTGLIAALQFNKARMREAASDPELLATDLAERLVRDGVPFRLAHGIAAHAVRQAEIEKVGLDQVVERSWRRMGLESKAAARLIFDPGRSLRAREQLGSPGPRATAHALESARARLVANRSWARSLRRRLPA